MFEMVRNIPGGEMEGCSHKVYKPSEHMDISSMSSICIDVTNIQNIHDKEL